LVLGDELTPISRLSAAFLSPPSAEHLQFAYYESSLVVEFFVERFGLDQLKALLDDLGRGTEINQAIETHTAPMASVEKEFAAYARRRAEKLAPGLDFEKPKDDALSTAGTNSFGAERQATNFWAMTRRAEELARAKKWTEVKELSQQLVALYPGFTGADSAYRLLAAAHRELGETNDERRVLALFAEKDNQSLDAYRRLMELALAEHDWPAVAQNAQRYLAVDPLVALPHHALASASEHLGQAQTAISEYRTLLELDPPDPAEAHFDLARALHRADDPEARRQVLQALEDAPRYRAALRLLLEIESDKSANEEYE
jgi:tetratricopeptide (TPR) repeat protein